MKISIVIPTLNEEKNIPAVVKGVRDFFRNKDYDYEILVVDGYSSDRTVEVAKKYGARILYDRYGKGSALIRGMKANGDIIVTMDADCSHTAKEIGLMIEGISSGFDICMGSRFIQGGGTADMPFVRKIGNKIFVYMVNRIWGMNYSDLCYGYRSFSRKAVRKIKLKSKGFGIETEIAIAAAKKKLRVLEIPSYEKPRASGSGKLRTFKDGFTVLRTILSEIVG